jgi:hypothetical protein
MDQCSIADVRASVPRKITWRLIPFLFLLYVIACRAVAARRREASGAPDKSEPSSS